MSFTEIPDDAYDGDEPIPDFDEWDSPDSLFNEGPIRERLLDVVVGIRTPRKVSEIAEYADCDTETARDYLEWFNEMGMVHRHDGRPVRYARNDAYFEWRRIDRIREEYSDQEIATALTDTLEQLEAYREQFGADHPDDVSLVAVTQDLDMSTEAAWEALSEWKSLTKRAHLLDAARRDHPLSRKTVHSADV